MASKEIRYKEQTFKLSYELANLLTFYIEQFIEQIDSVEHGAQ